MRKKMKKEVMPVNAVTNNKTSRLLFFVLLIPCFFVIKNLDNDIWFILNSGRYVLQQGIPYIEPFTIHQGMSFVMQQWLTAVIFWLSYATLGKVGLYLVIILTYALFILLTFKLCMFLSEENFFVSYAVTLISAVLICAFITERPQIFTFVFIVIEIYSLERYIKSSKAKWLLPLVALSVLLSNFQAAMWPILFVILIPYIIDSFKLKVGFIEGQGYGKGSLIVITLVMFAAGFLNPYGAGAVTYLYKSYGFPEISNFVSEMLPAAINEMWGKIILITLFIVLLVKCTSRKGTDRLRFRLLALGTAYLALSSIRSYPLFVICGIIPLSYFLKEYKISDDNKKADKRTLLIRKVLVVILVIVSLLNIYNLSTCKDKEFQELEKSANFLEGFNKNEVKLYTDYNSGGYLEFRGFKVYIDPRAEVFLETNNNKYNIMKEFIDMKHGKIYYKEVLNKYNFTHLLVSKNDILGTYLPYDDDYKVIYSSDEYKIYENTKLNK